MRKILVLLMLLGLAASLLAVTGCGEKKTTVKIPGGEEVTVEEKGGKVTYKGEEGEVTYETSEEVPSEDALGAPIYPGAEYVPGSGGSASASGPEGEFTTAGGEFVTKDSFDKVVGFYTDELGDPMVVDTAAKEASWMIERGDDSIVTVTVTAEDGKVKIGMARIGGKS